MRTAGSGNRDQRFYGTSGLRLGGACIVQLCQGPGRPKSSSCRKDVVQKHWQSTRLSFLKSISMYLHVSKPSTDCFKLALVFQGTRVVYTQALCSEIESNFFCRTTFSQLPKVIGVCALCFNFLVFCSRLLYWRVVFWHTPFKGSCGNACPNPRSVCGNAHSVVPFD